MLYILLLCILMSTVFICINNAFSLAFTGVYRGFGIKGVIWQLYYVIFTVNL